MVQKKENLKILVTGGKGFLGRHLMKALKDKGYKVSSFDMLDGEDICNMEQVDKAVKGKNAVFHLAAVADLNYARKYPRKAMDINVVGTINVAEACAKYNIPLHYASTCCAYGNQDKHPIDEKSHPNPTEIYAYSKLAGENIVKGYWSQFGMPYTIIRLATFYGEGMRAALAPFLFLHRAIKNEPIHIHGTGNQTRTFTHVEDIVDGMVKILEKGIKNEIINLTTEEEISVSEMAKRVVKLTNSKSEIFFTEDRPGQIYQETHSAKKALKLLNWKTKVSFNTGLANVYTWLKDDNELQRRAMPEIKATLASVSTKKLRKSR